jgi:uncharacterized small protein (DUF1192 family)
VQQSSCLIRDGEAGNTPVFAGSAQNRDEERMAADDEDRPRKKITHEIGQDLALLSVAELNERIALLQGEIERLQTAAASKQASRSAADKFFKS